MNISQMLVLIIGIILIGFIVWWFFGKHKEATEVELLLMMNKLQQL